jgi:hypothetical protein
MQHDDSKKLFLQYEFMYARLCIGMRKSAKKDNNKKTAKCASCRIANTMTCPAEEPGRAAITLLQNATTGLPEMLIY